VAAVQRAARIAPQFCQLAGGGGGGGGGGAAGGGGGARASAACGCGQRSLHSCAASGHGAALLSAATHLGLSGPVAGAGAAAAGCDRRLRSSASSACALSRSRASASLAAASSSRSGAAPPAMLSLHLHAAASRRFSAYGAQKSVTLAAMPCYEPHSEVQRHQPLAPAARATLQAAGSRQTHGCTTQGCYAGSSDSHLGSGPPCLSAAVNLHGCFASYCGLRHNSLQPSTK